MYTPCRVKTFGHATQQRKRTDRYMRRRNPKKRHLLNKSDFEVVDIAVEAGGNFPTSYNTILEE